MLVVGDDGKRVFKQSPARNKELSNKVAKTLTYGMLGGKTDAELITGHVPGPHEAAFQRLMIGAIDGDGALFQTSEPARMESSEG